LIVVAAAAIRCEWKWWRFDDAQQVTENGQCMGCHTGAPDAWEYFNVPPPPPIAPK
jgi:hypothetical protein